MILASFIVPVVNTDISISCCGKTQICLIFWYWVVLEYCLVNFELNVVVVAEVNYVYI